jgi:hypothetical protein
MIPAGSNVHIESRKRAVSSRKNWTHEFRRPIHFLMTRDFHFSGWCELDRQSEWLTVISRPVSPASSRPWKYREEMENIGRVTSWLFHLTDQKSLQIDLGMKADRRSHSHIAA